MTLRKRVAAETVAVLPAWLRPGMTVWYWRESLCDDDGCMDIVAAGCPLNRGVRWFAPEAHACSRRHPVLDSAEIFAVSAIFTARGLTWSVNDLPDVASNRLRDVSFPSREEAEKHRPKEVVWGVNL